MKIIIASLVFFYSIVMCAQENQAPSPKNGMELFLNNLEQKVSIPFSYYEREGFTMHISVDSLATVKLTSLDPFTSSFYKELKAYVEQTSWVVEKTSSTELPKTFIVPVKLDKQKIANMQKAYPKEGLPAFYEAFVKYIFTTYYRNFKFSSYKVVFEVDEKGKLRINEIKPDDGAFRFEATRFLERKTDLWTPAMIDGKPVKSTFTLPIKFQQSSH